MNATEMERRPAKPVLRDATVFVLDDAEIGGQCLLVVSKEGGFFLPSPGGSVKALSLSEMKEYFGGPGAAQDQADMVMKEICRLTTEN